MLSREFAPFLLLTSGDSLPRQQTNNSDFYHVLPQLQRYQLYRLSKRRPPASCKSVSNYRWPVGKQKHHSLHQKEGAYTGTVGPQLRMPCSVFLQAQGEFDDKMNVDPGNCKLVLGHIVHEGLDVGQGIHVQQHETIYSYRI